MEFINKLKEMEELDSVRRLANTKALNNDFVISNADLKKEKKEVYDQH